MDMIVTLLVVFLLAGLATWIRFFGGEGMIAGYNTASAQEKAYMKEKGIGKFVGNYLYLLAGVIWAGYLLRLAGVHQAPNWSWAVFAVVIVIMLIQARRFNPPGPPSQQRRRTLLLALLVIVLTGVIVGWYALPPRVETGLDQLTIGGAYGTTVSYKEIKEVVLKDQLPPTELRTNGVSMGPTQKGHFQLKDGTGVLMFVQRSSAPVILIEFSTDRKTIILNQSNPQDTIWLYETIRERSGS